MIIDIYYGVNDMKVFVLFSPATYEGECGTVYGVFSSKEEADKYKRPCEEIQEHTINNYFSDDIKFYY